MSKAKKAVKTSVKAAASTQAAAKVQAAVAKALDYIKLSTVKRAEMQSALGIGLNAGATYINAGRVECGALDSTLDAIKAGKFVWADGDRVIVVKGAKGITARYGRVTTDGAFVEVIGTTGAKGILSTSIFGDKGELRVLTVKEFAALAQKGAQVRFTRKHDSQTFHGRAFGGLDGDIIGLVYGNAKSGMLIVDIETDANNIHNELVRGHVGGESDATAHAVTDRVLASVVKSGSRRGK